MQVTDQQFTATVADVIPGYEHTRLVEIDELFATERGKTVFSYDEICAKGPVGNVVSTFDKEGVLYYVVEDIGHLCNVGATGSGKSTGPTAAQIDCNMHAGLSMVVSDTKGKLYQDYAARLKENGYRVLLLNLKDPYHSERINPLARAARTIASFASVGEGASVSKRADGGKAYVYNGRTYGSAASLAKAYRMEVEKKKLDAIKEVRDLIARLHPIESQKDPHWERVAWKSLIGLFSALAMDVFETSPTRKTTPEQVNYANMGTVFRSFGDIRRMGGVDDKNFFRRRGEQSWVLGEVRRSLFDNAENTTRNYVGFVEEAFANNFPGFEELTKCDTFDPKSLASEKTALFLVYDEMDVLCHRFISCLISFLLKELKTVADAKETMCLDKPIMFLIDEFSTLPANEDIINFIAFGRSRGIYVHFVVQSFSQLEEKYENAWKGILNNCSDIIFLGTNDYDTIHDLSVQFGKRTQSAISTDLEKGIIGMEERPTVTETDLSGIRHGEAYVKRFRKMPLKGAFEKSFLRPEYKCPITPLADYEDPVAETWEQYEYDVSLITLDQEACKSDDDDDLF